MIILAAPPPTTSRLTGGYRYNDEVAARLGDGENFRYLELPLDELRGFVRDALRRDAKSIYLLLDSLYFGDDASSGGGSSGSGSSGSGSSAGRDSSSGEGPIEGGGDPSFGTDFSASGGPAETLRSLFSEERIRTGLLCHQLPGGVRGATRAGNAIATGTLPEEAQFPELDFYVVPSSFMAHELARRGVRRSSIHICAPGIAGQAALHKSSMSVRRRATMPVRLLTVSNDTETKNLPWLAELLAELTDISWEWHVVGRMADNLTEELLEEYGIASRTTLHGVLQPSAVAELMEHSSALLHPSRFESYGMVISEALSHGLPVVANDTGAIGELVMNRETGFLCPTDDHPAWYAALSRIATEPALRAALSATALERAERLPTWEETAACLRRAIRSADRRSGAGGYEGAEPEASDPTGSEYADKAGELP